MRTSGLCVAACVAATVSAAAAATPNVVLILADDLGYADLGCYGALGIRTPHLDRMASEGTRFTSFTVAQSVCTASRAALLTGCYPNRIGMAGALNHTSPSGIHPREQLLPHLLAARGYATAAYGKWHLGHHPPFWPTRRGFGDFFGTPYSNDNGPLHPTVRGMPPLPLYDGADVVEIDPDQSRFTRRLTERAVDFIGRHRDRPFFLYFPHVMPHVPIFASDGWRGRSAEGLYGDVVEELDWSVGEILAAIHAHGLDDRTLVVFTSDNGPFLSYGNHAGSARPLREGKLTTYEGGVRVPCIMRWPRTIPAGHVCDELATSLDLFTTTLRLAGAPMPSRPVDGIDLGPLVRGERGARGRETFWYYAGDELQAVRDGDWKLHLPHDFLTVPAVPGRDGKPANVGSMKPASMGESGIRGVASRHGYEVAHQPLALYDLGADPGESRDLAATHPDVVARLQKIADAARAELGDAIQGVKGRGVRAAGDVRPTLPSGVRRISDVEFSRPQLPVPMAMRLDLYLPEKPPPTPGPAVLWIHGGGWKHGSKEQCPLVWLAAEGIPVVSIEYRLSWQARWPAQIDDCRAAMDWLHREAARHAIDPRRIVVAGASAGGHLATLVGTAGDVANAAGVINFYGPCNLLTMPPNVPGPDNGPEKIAATHGARLLGGPVHERPDLAREASGLFHVSADDPPFLLIHGDRDPLVPLEQSTTLDAALRDAGVASRLIVLPGAGHGGPPFDADDVRRSIREFVQGAGRRPPPSE